MTEKHHTILIVDDAPMNIDMLKEMLGPLYNIKVATNGRLALKLAEMEPRPDLILLDVMMPDMDGYEVCRQLKQREATHTIPIIFVTARGEVEDETYGFEIGAADYLAKPVKAPIVLARVRTHLQLHDDQLFLSDLVRERTRQLENVQMELVLQLGRAGEFRDNETSAHTIRMAHYSRLLAERIGWSAAQCEMMFHAAMLHDVGKIGIPDHILLKPGKLTPEEFEVIKTHPEIGARIIGQYDAELLRLARSIALTHHEKFNGSGYPQRTAGEDIPLAGRIVALADVFDALTSPRVYKRSWSVKDALDHVKNEAGNHFDPELASLFVSLKPELCRIMDSYRDNEAG